MVRSLALAVMAGLALAAVAQQNPGVAEKIDVQLTNLDVVVTDRSGARISGLTQGDFEVLENGVRREITNLSEIRRGPAAEGASASAVPRRILVAIDNRTIPQSARKKTVAALRQTIDQLLGAGGDKLMIVTIAGSSRPRTEWTSDRAAIERALTEIEQEPAAARLDEAEINNMFADMTAAASGQMGAKASQLGRRRSTSVSAGTNTPTTPPSDEEEVPEDGRLAAGVDYNLLLTRARMYAGNRQGETRQTLGALTSSLNQFGTVPGGRRLVVLIGGALPLFPGSDIFQRLDAALRDIERHERATSMSAAGSKAQLSSPLMEKTGFDVTRDVDALATSARLKGIAFYAVNPDAGERTSKETSARFNSAGTDFATLNAAVDGFYRLSAATGGESHVGRNAEIAIADIQRDLDTYYSIGYRSTTPVSPDTKIVVKARGGLTTRATIAAAAVSPEWQVADQVLSQHFTESPSNELGIGLVTEPVPPAADGSRKMVVRVMIPFDRLSLARQGNEYACDFSVFVSVGDAAGGASPQQETRNFKWNAETVEKLRGKSIAYGVNLTVGPGRDRVSIGLLDLRSGKTGYARTLLQ
jgi:VWFA-related protein